MVRLGRGPAGEGRRSRLDRVESWRRRDLRRSLALRGYREEDRRALARLAAGSLGGSVEGWEEHYDPEKNPRLDPEQVYVVEEAGCSGDAAVFRSKY